VFTAAADCGALRAAAKAVIPDDEVDG